MLKGERELAGRARARERQVSRVRKVASRRRRVLAEGVSMGEPTLMGIRRRVPRYCKKYDYRALPYVVASFCATLKARLDLQFFILAQKLGNKETIIHTHVCSISLCLFLIDTRGERCVFREIRPSLSRSYKSKVRSVT